MALLMSVQCGHAGSVRSVARFRWPVDTRLRIGVPEALGSARVGVVWPVTSSTASRPSIMKTLGFRSHSVSGDVTTLSSWACLRLAMCPSIGIKPIYVASG